MRVAFAALIFLFPTSTAVLAQDDAMEAQRCIWRCLANSNGADDPAYQRCITEICDGGGPSEENITRRASPDSWAPATGVSYPAVVQCAADKVCLFVSCPTPGSMALELYGVVNAEGHAIDNAWDAGDAVQVRAGRASSDLVLPAKNSLDMYRWDLNDQLNQSLKSGARAQIQVGDNEWEITLQGSSAGIASVESRC